MFKKILFSSTFLITLHAMDNPVHNQTITVISRIQLLPVAFQIPVNDTTTIQEVDATMKKMCQSQLIKHLAGAPCQPLTQDSTELCALYRSWTTLKLCRHCSGPLEKAQTIKSVINHLNPDLFYFSLKDGI